MDTLSDILDLLQLRGTLYFQTAFSPPWSVAVPPHAGAARFHMVVQGRCMVRIGDQSPVTLEPGDLILIPDGAAHVLCDEPSGEPAPLERVLEESGYDGTGVLSWSSTNGADTDDAATTKLLCGHYSFANGADHPLLRALPTHLLVSADLRARTPLLDDMMRLTARQMFSGQLGATASVIRLSEAMFIEIVRACANQDPALEAVIDALADSRIGRAVTLMHRAMDQDWTLERIARDVGMSRSRFFDRFQSMMGCAPMTYLSDLRLQKAMNLLAETVQPVQTVATSVGYRSPAAFSRAFSNRYGCSPRSARRNASTYA